MSTLNYKPVSADQISQLVAKLQEGGARVVTPQTNTWRVEGHGITIMATYEPVDQNLQVNIASKPFFVPESMIDSQIKNNLG